MPQRVFLGWDRPFLMLAAKWMLERCEQLPGMLVVVPPQAYFEVVTKVAYAGSYLDFMRLYLAGYHGFCRGDALMSRTRQEAKRVPLGQLLTA